MKRGKNAVNVALAQAIAQAARQDIQGMVAKGSNSEQIAVQAQKTVDLVARKLPAPQCRQGCSFCCHQHVLITRVEAQLIARYLRALPELEQTFFGDRVGEVAQQTQGLDWRERANRKIPCPFLQAGSCSIYAVRPLQCRGVTSYDASICEREFQLADVADCQGAPASEELLHVAQGMQLALEWCLKFSDVGELTQLVHESFIQPCQTP
ncbi:MAG: YkgJ family cysteine cluster protein [Chloroflexaceae bacterium]|nr:YkgJ family cysteine cluster protein [Chloroflexaceae bacterium]